MYADMAYRSRGISPGSLATAVAINGALVAAVIFAAPEITKRVPPTVLIGRNIPVPPPPKPFDPPPVKKPAQPRQQQFTKADPPERIDPTTPTDPNAGWVTPSGGGTAIDTSGTVTIDPPPPPLPPALVDPVVDSRFAGNFQPDYPPQERRLEREGSVELRVLIGIDGRVKAIERVSATSDDFFNATRRTALARWRFRPGTRGGVPVEAWKTMRVTFRLTAE